MLAMAVLLPAATSTAEAQPRHAGKFEVQRANTTSIDYLGKRDGYDVVLSMPSNRVAVLYVSRFEQEDGSYEGASSGYAVRVKGSLESGVVRARLGSLGRISLRFQPSGRVRKHHNSKACRGRPAVTEYGRFVGHVEFDGEGGYLHASFTGAKGEITHWFRLTCRQYEAQDFSPKSLREYVAPIFGFLFSPGQGSVSLLNVAARSHRRYIGIRAAHQEGSLPGAEVQLGTVESKDGMAIGRSAYVEGVPGTLLTSLPGERPATATLAPPAPFFGEADYLENSATSHSWTGTLGVNLPGLTLPLTGPGFYTSLCVVSPLKVRDGCDFLKPKPLEPER